MDILGRDNEARNFKKLIECVHQIRQGDKHERKKVKGSTPEKQCNERNKSVNFQINI